MTKELEQELSDQNTRMLVMLYERQRLHIELLQKKQKKGERTVKAC